MKWREEVIGDARLICADCREVLPTLGKVDAVVTDPPFGVGFKYATHDDSPSAYVGGYGRWLWERLEMAEGNLCPGSPVFVWQSGANLRQFNEWFPREWRLFVAAKNFVQMRPTAMQWSFDPVAVWWTPGEKPWSAGTASRDFHMANTAPIVATPENIEKGHPCPRPLDQVSHIVGQWVRPAGVVLDIFMGSGTGGVAAIATGRKFIGVEIDPAYFDLACRRIEAAYRQPRLFDEPVVKPVQPSLLDAPS